MNYPKEYFAIKVFQPFGDFFIFKMTAKELLDVSFSDALRYDEDKNLNGSQRFLDEKKRVKEILTRGFNIDKNISVDYFSEIVNKFYDIDFSDNFFTASGVGKSRIQNIILIRIGFKNLDDIRNDEEKPDNIRLANIKS